MFDDFLSVIGALASIVFLIVIAPFIYFWFAYLGGWIASITIGNILATGLNTMFNVTWFTKDMIPLCAVLLAGSAASLRIRPLFSERIKTNEAT